MATSAIENGCIQETIAFIAPKILGGDSSMTPFADFNFEDMNEVKILNKGSLQILNGDIFINNYLVYNDIGPHKVFVIFSLFDFS